MREMPAEHHDEDAEDEAITEVEVIDRSLVLAADRPPVVRYAPQGVALAQTAAVAATGFVAGIATAAVLGRRRQRRLPGPAAAPRSPAALPPLGPQRAVSRRTYLVDVQLIERHLP